MSDAVQSQEMGAAPDVTAGALLRQAREAAGLHVAALAVSLKVPVRKLEALEENRWDVLPDAVFVRALASSVCRTLKVDPKPILDRLPQNAAPRLINDGEGINAPFRAPSDGAPPSWMDQLSKPVFLAVFALLLGALVLILLPTTQTERAVTASSTTTEPAPPPAPVVIPGPPTAAAPAPVPASSPAVSAPATVTLPAASAAHTPMVAAAASAPRAAASSVVAATPVVASPAAGTTSAAVAAATPASGIVVFRTKGPSWVEVTDGKGIVAMRRQLEAGETAGASGVLPLQVVIGRVDHTDVQVRGKPFDLKPVSRDNVARFEVK